MEDTMSTEKTSMVIVNKLSPIRLDINPLIFADGHTEMDFNIISYVIQRFKLENAVLNGFSDIEALVRCGGRLWKMIIYKKMDAGDFDLHFVLDWSPYSFDEVLDMFGMLHKGIGIEGFHHPLHDLLRNPTAFQGVWI
jgi:hypothetical protein